MKFFTKSQKIAGQSNQKLRKPQKHDANLRKNSSLYFQIGLILCLLATYGLFQMKFETIKPPIIVGDPWDDTDPILINDYDIQDEPIVMADPQPKPKVQVLNSLEPIIKDDLPNISEPTLKLNPVIDAPVIKVKVTPKVPVLRKSVKKSYSLGELEVVPIYPGCEKENNNGDRIKCMSKKLTRLIQNRFDTGLGSEYGLSGVQKISVQFTIDQQGNVTDVKTRAPHPVLEEEAVRLANRIPSMQPGKQASHPVSVLYNLPITFKVND